MFTLHVDTKYAGVLGSPLRFHLKPHGKPAAANMANRVVNFDGCFSFYHARHFGKDVATAAVQIVKLLNPELAGQCFFYVR